MNYWGCAALHDAQPLALKGHYIYSLGQRPMELRILNFETSVRRSQLRIGGRDVRLYTMRNPQP